jgi:ABC-type phosphate transport system substrate-binding protein
MRHQFSTLVAAGILMLGGISSSTAKIISGSDLLGPAIEEVLSAELSASGIDNDLLFEGSLQGVKSVESGESAAAILAIADNAERPSGMTLFPVGYQVVSFAVNSDNPVNELTYAQLSGMFADSGSINSWGDLSDDIDWKDRSITPWAARSSSTMSLELFNAVVVEGYPLKQAVRYSGTTGDELLNLALEDSSSIVLVPQIQTIPSVRFLAIKSEESGQAYTPSADNVFFGDYPLRLPFYLAVGASTGREEVAGILKSLFSPAVTDAMTAAGFVPIPESERRSILSQFE